MGKEKKQKGQVAPRELAVFPPDKRSLEDIPLYQLDVNQLDISGLAPLHWAIRTSAVEKVKSLIECDADVNLRDRDGISPLKWAALQNSSVIMSILLEQGSRIDGIDDPTILPNRESFIRANEKLAEQKVEEASNTQSRFLQLSFLYISHLPEKFCLLTETLQDLCLSFNNLAELPIEVTQISSLTRLDCSNNLLTELPKEISKLANVRILTCKRNFLRDVPEVCEWDNLNELDLSYNQISVIPPELFRLNRLITLNLSHNFIVEVPTKVEMPGLTKLCLSHNYILMLQDLPIGQLISLESLDISHNQIVVVPFKDIMSAKHIKLFRFGHNRLPKDIFLIMTCYYDQLETLDLSSLGLNTLRDEISLLTNLKELSIRNNVFSSVPLAIGTLTNLTSLDMSFNKFTDLPLFLYRLSKLEHLNLEETRNHITNPPKSVVDRGLKAIMGHFADLLTGEPCYRMKLMLVGQENVGKSSLLHALINLRNKKSRKRGNISTDGIDIERWTFKTNKQNITFSAWDFAGQEIYYTTHSFFLSQKAIYILVWDLRYPDDSSRIEFWLNSVYSRATSAPVLLVATHLDDPMFENNIEKVNKILVEMNEKYSRFTNIRGIAAVSTLNGDGVQTLLDLLTKIAMDMPSMKMELPKIYLNLEEQILAVKDKENPPAISWNAFMQLASSVNFKDEDQLLRATHFLNDLGSLVYFEDDKTYERLIVLDPQWLTSMFASVITTSHTYIKDGILFYKNLKQIWKPPQYPEHLHASLISLLEQFEILLELPAEEDSSSGTNEKRFLVPSLLPEEKPPIDLLWLKHDDQMQFARCIGLEFLPNGLFSRFMVRFLHFAEKPLKYWRNGVLAQRGQDKALVELEGKVIKITTRGEKAAELLRIVIEIVDTLVNSWFKVKITSAQVPCPHCVTERVGDEEVYMFELKECEEAAARGNTRILKCPKGDVPVRLDSLVPDIAMTDFEGSEINFNELEIDKKLGKGSFGIIYKGTWRGETVAIKRLKVEEDMAIAAFSEFRREVWLMSGLAHPCIVNLKGYCTHPLVMVMECVSGGDLYEFIHNESITIDWHLRLKIALDMAHGMAFLHNVNPPLLHRDLKSPNVLVSDWQVGSPVVAKVADFGLSSRLFVDRLHDRAVENPTWCAPEVMKKKPYTEKADVYSYGVMLWELLTRHLPFEECNFQHQVEDNVINGIRPPIPDTCWPGYADMIRACWHDDPNKRPDFTEVVDRLIQLIRSEIGESEFNYPLDPTAGHANRAPRKKQATQSNSSVLSAVVGTLAKQLETNIKSSITCLLHVTNQVWCGSTDGSISIFSAESGRYLTTYKTQQQGISCLSLIGDKVWSGGLAGDVGIWKTEDLVTEEMYDIKIKSGVLRKKGGAEKKVFSKVQPRWCELYKSGNFKMFKQQGSTNPEVEIYLKNTVVDVRGNKIDLQTPDKKFTLQATNDEEAMDWSLELKKVIARFLDTPACQEALRKLIPGHSIVGILELNENQIMIASATNCLRIVDPMLRVKEQIHITVEDDESPPKVSFILDMNEYIWLAVNRDVILFHSSKLKQELQFPRNHTAPITAMANCARNSWTADATGLLLCWASDGTCLRRIPPDTRMEFNCLLGVGDKIWCASSAKEIIIFNSLTGDKLKTLRQHQDSVTSLCLVLNLIWSASSDKTICIWN